MSYLVHGLGSSVLEISVVLGGIFHVLATKSDIGILIVARESMSMLTFLESPSFEVISLSCGHWINACLGDASSWIQRVTLAYKIANICKILTIEIYTGRLDSTGVSEFNHMSHLLISLKSCANQCQERKDGDRK